MQYLTKKRQVCESSHNAQLIYFCFALVNSVIASPNLHQTGQDFTVVTDREESVLAGFLPNTYPMPKSQI